MSSSTSIQNMGPYIQLQPVEKPKLEIQLNGKIYEITKIRTRIGGEKEDWRETDLSQLSPAEREKLIEAVKQAYETFGKLDKTAPAELQTAQTLSLQLFQKGMTGPGLMNKTLGLIFKQFAWKPEPVVLRKILYQASKGSPFQTYQLHLERYSPKDQEEMNELIKPLAEYTKQMTELEKTSTRAIRKDKNTSSA